MNCLNNIDREYQKKLHHFQLIMQIKGYKIFHTKSQRIYTLSPMCPVPPPKGTEIYVDKLPVNVLEDEVYQFFLKIGPIYMLRMMIGMSGTRGFAFVTYFKKEDANVAVSSLNGYHFRLGADDVRLLVHFSLDNRCLFVGNIPREKSLEEVHAELKCYMKGLVDVTMYKDPNNKEMNRSFAFVEFESHGKAGIARRLNRGHLIVWSRLLSIDWAVPIPVISPTVLAKVKTIIILDNFINTFILLKSYTAATLTLVLNSGL